MLAVNFEQISLDVLLFIFMAFNLVYLLGRFELNKQCSVLSSLKNTFGKAFGILIKMSIAESVLMKAIDLLYDYN